MFLPRNWLLSAAVSSLDDARFLADKLDMISTEAPTAAAAVHIDDRTVPLEKLLLTVPFSARIHTLSYHPLSAASAGRSLTYSQICQLLEDGDWLPPAGESATSDHLAVGGDVSRTKDGRRIDYSTPQSIAASISRHVGGNRLGGVLISAVDSDDYQGLCGDRWPLLKAVNAALQRAAAQSIGGDGDGGEDARNEFPCGPVDGFYRDPDDCGRFYRCHASQSFTFACAAGLWFNEDTKLCDYPQRVDCQQQQPVAESRSQIYSVSINQLAGRSHHPAARQLPSAYKLVCYLSSWSWLRPAPAQFVPERLSGEACTHLIYAYAGLDPVELIVQSADRWTDTDHGKDGGMQRTHHIDQMPAV